MDSGGAGSTLLVVTAVAVVPVLLMVTTSFVKLSLVFSLLRNALGTTQVPSGLIVAAVAALLSLYVMAPVASQMLQASEATLARVDWQGEPLRGASGVALWESVEKAHQPLSEFLSRNAGARETRLFVDLSRRMSQDGEPRFDPRHPMVAMPAFLLTELAEAFQIGFLVFLPFLIIDLVVANILLALGMHMMSPTSFSLPFKLLLFVLVDGFVLLTEALVAGYH